MDVEVKDGIYFLSFAASLGASWSWMKGKLSSLDRRFKSQEKEIDCLRKKITGDHGEPLLMSYDAHDKICGRKQEIVNIKLENTSSNVAEIKDVVKGINKSVGLILEQQAVIMERQANSK